MCGELKFLLPARSLVTGSSPRVWGTHGSGITCPFNRRFIPTCVGNSPPGNWYLRSLPVHPHVCGELGEVKSSLVVVCGSSPRVWGTHSNRLQVQASIRFIPTCVGNSRPIPDIWRRPPVHPHVCGELICTQNFSIKYSGSSPRVWGTPFPL